MHLLPAIVLPHALGARARTIEFLKGTQCLIAETCWVHIVRVDGGGWWADGLHDALQLARREGGLVDYGVPSGGAASMSGSTWPQYAQKK